jgi:hypothetical protein
VRRQHQPKGFTNNAWLKRAAAFTGKLKKLETKHVVVINLEFWAETGNQS